MKMIVFSGLPGTGKSMLAEALGKHLSIPVFARDWLEATLLRCELNSTKEGKSLGWAGYELLTILAERQFMLEQSAILDSVAGMQPLRSTWHQLAARYDAAWLVIECICSDEAVHRSRLNQRKRGIPGWHELEWSDVEKVKQYFVPWTEERLVLDMVHPFVVNLSKVKKYCE